ncbi:MAG: ferritin family protein [Syntrophobacteraceae bacterium]
MSYDFNAAEVYKIAITIEENGKRFYEESQKSIDVPEVKQLFAELAQQEVDHKHRFESLMAQIPPASSAPTVWDPENELDKYIKMMADMHIFVGDITGQVTQVKDARSALKMAIEFEKDSVIFFLSLEDAMAGQKDQELIKTLVKEEQAHLRRLTLELNKLK